MPRRAQPDAGSDMATNWRISSFNGALLAAYFFRPGPFAYDHVRRSCALAPNSAASVSDLQCPEWRACLAAGARPLMSWLLRGVRAAATRSRSARPAAATRRSALRSVRQRDQLCDVIGIAGRRAAACGCMRPNCCCCSAPRSCCWSRRRRSRSRGDAEALSLQQTQLRDDRCASLTAWLAAGTPQ